MANLEEFRVFDLHPSYSISSHWNVFNNKTWKFRKLNNNHGYYQVWMNIWWKNRYFAVHRLVAYLFKWLDIFNTDVLVLHKDDNGHNNNVDNLIIGTHKDNSQDMLSKWRCNPPSWKNHYRTRISQIQKEEIRLLYSEWKYQKDIWKIYWVWQDHISRILNNKERTH